MAKAKALQDEIRRKRGVEEKRLNEESEKMRIQNTKMMSDTKRLMDEQRKKIDLDYQKIEKKEFNDAKSRMLEQLRRDKEARFGKSYAGAETSVPGQVAPKKVDPIDSVKAGLKMIRTLYTEERNPGIAKTCFSTMKAYLSNVLKDVNEEKYRKIKLTNEAFNKRVGKINGGLQVLKGAGFEDAGEELVMTQVNETLIREALRLIENNLN